MKIKASVLKISISLLLLFCLFIVSGCGSVLKCVPEKTMANNDYFYAALKSDHQAFYLTVKNKSSKNIEIDWYKTLFIDPLGGTNGLFTFGTEFYYEDKDFKYPTTVIFPGTSIDRTLYPIAHRYFVRSGWKWYHLDLGTNGMLLTVLADGKEVSEKITFEFVSEKRSIFKKDNVASPKTLPDQTDDKPNKGFHQRGIVLNDKNIIYGEIVELNTEQVKIKTNDGTVKTVPFKDVHSFIK